MVADTILLGLSPGSESLPEDAFAISGVNGAAQPPSPLAGKGKLPGERDGNFFGGNIWRQYEVPETGNG